jgi:hypothetical protein
MFTFLCVYILSMAKHVGAQVNENRNYEKGEAKVGTNVYLMIGGKQYTLPYESLRKPLQKHSSEISSRTLIRNQPLPKHSSDIIHT